MAAIKLIALDMDGTLLGKTRGIIPPVNLAALKEASARGVKLCFASGRAPDDVSFHAVDAGLTAHVISLNGSVTLNEPLGEIATSTKLSEHDATAIYAMAKEFKLRCAAFCEHDIVTITPPNFPEVPMATWGTFMRREGTRTHLYYDEPSMLERLSNVSKFLVTTIEDFDGMAAFRRRVTEAFPHLEVTSSWADNVEINPTGVNKGSALTALADTLGIPMSQVMAIGDNDNDISMLRAAGTGVAMGNATPGAMAASDYVTLHHLENGVAAAIRALVLGENVPGVTPTV